MSDSDDDVPIARRLAVKPEIKSEMQGTQTGAPVAGPNQLISKSERIPKTDPDVPTGGELVDTKAQANANAEAGTMQGKPAKKRNSPGSKDSKDEKKKGKVGTDSKPKDKNGPQQKENDRKQGVPKKVYEMPGQTRDTPPEEDPLRRFYTSLLEQVPNSEMARRWCAIHGLLDTKAAAAWVEEQARRRGNKSPSKSQQRRPASKTGSMGEGKKKKMKKRRADSGADHHHNDDSDFKSTKSVNKKPKEKIKKPSEKNLSKSTRDVAFADGGLDGSDSDDDVPLHVRLQKAKAGRA